MNRTKQLFSQPLLLDGAMGTMLLKHGLKTGERPELLCLTAPDAIEQIHRDYFAAGAQVVYTNTFGASGLKLQGSGHTPEEVIPAAVAIARKAAADFGGLVALDIGPLGELLEPMGTLPFEAAYGQFREQILAGASGADLIVIETMTDLQEMRAALLAAKENSPLPVFCSMSFDEGGRTFTGCDVRAMALTLEGMGADAIGINCSLGPFEIYPIAQELAQWTSLPLLIKANAGLPAVENGETVYKIGPEEYARGMARFLDLGASILGGCCGTDPRYIAALREAVAGRSPASRQKVIRSAVCSPSQVVELDRARIVGERINPTGKPAMKQALLDGDYSYLARQGIQQAEAGAHLLDVNVGLPGLDEAAAMKQAVKALQEVLDLPLVLDSSSPAALEAALRVYCGRAVINSVSGKEESMAQVFPLARKYGAMVIGLTLDENGIPSSARERLAVAKKIRDRALSYGIPEERLLIDCLTLTVSSGQRNATETLEAVALVKRELGLKTILGVSNISFGLPAREALNQAFLSMALGRGLDIAILNPNNKGMMDAFFASATLTGQDTSCAAFLSRFAGESETKPLHSGQDMEIGHAIARGLRAQAREACLRLLSSLPPMEIVNRHLIPVLDQVGRDYEEGRIFLPQLIQSAEAAKSAFELLKETLAKEGPQTHSKGAILLATVEGDIHDIGKNIVKAVLENYGYTILDLGKDVPPAAVVQAAKERDIRLVGLSALMTTTVPSMEKTIRLLRQELPQCKVMVGGAVLTAEYAKSIGADFYAADAQQSVQFARQVLG